MGKFALLLSGGINANANEYRYRNDLQWAFKVLTQDCGYKKDDIDVFFANGKGIWFDKEIVAVKPAAREQILFALTKVANTTTKSDIFVMVVSNHGEEENGGSINLWGSEVLGFDELVEHLNEIPARKIIILGECYAGNILEREINNSCIITANEKGKPSFTHPFRYDYEELIKHFFAYIHKGYPDGSVIPLGENDVRKAFEYARDNDVFKPGAEYQKRFGAKQIPQIKCNIAEKVSL